MVSRFFTEVLKVVEINRFFISTSEKKSFNNGHKEEKPRLFFGRSMLQSRCVVKAMQVYECAFEEGSNFVNYHLKLYQDEQLV